MKGSFKPIEVIIIGGGPVGLSAAICLAHQGVRSTLVEKHPTTTHHPKARGVNGRTMELFRLWGLEESLQPYQMSQDAHGFTWLTDFHKAEITRVQATENYQVHSPAEKSVIAQDDVERELFKKAKSHPLIELRFNTEMTSATQNDQLVSIEVLDKTTGQEEVISAHYLIGADGARSTLREIFQVEMEGADNLGVFCNIYCEMNLDKYVKARPSVGYMFTRSDILGTFLLAKAGLRKWLLGVKLDPERNLTEERFTDEFCIEYVKKVIDDPEIEVRLINTSFWTMAALIAKRYRIGRVFLAGDAAHRLPPTGGFGMNTGIQDAHNLAWKLAMVLKGEAKDALLDTYFTERVQIAKTNIEWSIHNAKRFEKIFISLAQNDLKAFEEALQDQTHHLNNLLLDIGFVYGSDYHSQEAYKPTTRVGARAPHCWLTKGVETKSILDLYDNEFILICHPEAHYWQDQFRQFPCKIVTIGDGGEYHDTDGDFLEKYEISRTGAVLVRPDGHVAWRSQDANGKSPHFPWLIKV